MKKSNVREYGRKLAFAGIGAAVSLVFVVLSYYVNYLTLSFTVFSSMGIMIPLALYYYKESFLSAVVTISLGVIFANIKILPYVLASGVYVLITTLMYDKKLNIIITILIKLAYYCFVFYVLYKLTNLLVVDVDKISFLQNISQTWLYVIFNLVFVVCFFIYDILIIQGVKLARQIANKLKLTPKKKDKEKINEALQNNETQNDKQENDYDDIFKF